MNAQMQRRLDGLAQWHNTSSGQMAKYILEEALNELWKTYVSDIEEMERGLEYFNTHLS